MFAVAIDYGKKVSGLARAALDSELLLATPYKVLDTSKLLDFLRDNKKDIAFIVLGKSLNLKGGENPIQKEIDKFARQLQSEGFKVFFEDERFSTKEAAAESLLLQQKQKTRKPKSKKRLDASAASLVLQSFLEKNPQIVKSFQI